MKRQTLVALALVALVAPALAADIALTHSHLTSLTARDLIAAIPAALQSLFPEPTSSQDATHDLPPLPCRKSPK